MISAERLIMWVVAFLTVLSIAPSTINSLTIHRFTEEDYYREMRKKSPIWSRPECESFADKLESCKEILSHDYFKAQPAQILDPSDEEMYAELKRSNFYAKYQPNNKTLFENPNVQLKIVAHETVFENFRVKTRKHSLIDFAFTCIVRGTEEPHNVEQFFLSPPLEYSNTRYVFVYNQQDEIVVMLKALNTMN